MKEEWKEEKGENIRDEKLQMGLRCTKSNKDKLTSQAASLRVKEEKR